MSKNLIRIHDHLSKFAPIVSIDDGDPIRIQFAPGATKSQKAAARAKLQNLDRDKPVKDVDDIRSDIANLTSGERQLIDNMMRAEWLNRNPHQADALGIALVRKRP